MIRRVLLPVMALTAMACSNTSGPSRTAGSSRLIFSVSAGTSAAAPALAPETIGLGSDVLVLNQVDLVIREIQLNRVGRTSGCDSDGDSNDDSNQAGANEKNGDNNQAGDDCEEVEVGPLLVTLPLGGATAQKIEVSLAPGTYDRVEFEIHKPDGGDSTDRAFLAVNPAFRGVSIRARGTFNGTAFEYLSDLSAEQELRLSPPLVLAQGGTAQLSLTIDARGWFLDAVRNRLVNPATALKGQPNEGLVKQNIKNSIGAKGDNDRDR